MSGPFVYHTLSSVGKRAVSHIMKQSRQTQNLPRFRKGSILQFRHLPKRAFHDISFDLREPVERKRGDMHGAKGVLKPRMSCPGIEEFSQSELFDETQPAKERVVDNAPFVWRETNETVHGTSHT